MAHHDGLPYEPNYGAERDRLAHEAECVADRYTPSITDDAAKAALKIYVQFAGKPQDAMRAAILSVLPGLTSGREQEAFRRGVTIGKAEGEASELYPAHWGFDAIQAERRHRERMAAIQAETEARTIAQMVNYPTDYEVWRDAVFAANTRLGNAADRAQVVETAEWLWHLLQEVPMQQQGVAPCPDCQGENGNHFTGCSVGG